MEKDSVRILLNNGSKFLILKRSTKNKYFLNHWELPGGKIERKENPRQAIIREVEEETGVIIKQFKKIAKMNKENSKHFIVYFYAKTTLKKIKISSEHSKFEWATLNEIKRKRKQSYKQQFLNIIDKIPK